MLITAILLGSLAANAQLQDGDLLFAGQQFVDILALPAFGALHNGQWIRLNGIGFIDMGVDGQGNIYVAKDIIQVQQVDLATGAVLAGPYPTNFGGANNIAFALEIYRPRAAAAADAAVPALPPLALVLLALAFVLIATKSLQ